mmetsp:Transcript_12208/g.40116  ORF Transcript_12208/g.40116 Transcript_12208/m.40116 type:complete len:252 (+) Transcript_12208:1089-1844(+)
MDHPWTLRCPRGRRATRLPFSGCSRRGGMSSRRSWRRSAAGTRLSTPPHPPTPLPPRQSHPPPRTPLTLTHTRLQPPHPQALLRRPPLSRAPPAGPPPRPNRRLRFPPPWMLTIRVLSLAPPPPTSPLGPSTAQLPHGAALPPMLPLPPMPLPTLPQLRRVSPPTRTRRPWSLPLLPRPNRQSLRRPRRLPLHCRSQCPTPSRLPPRRRPRRPPARLRRPGPPSVPTLALRPRPRLSPSSQPPRRRSGTFR